MSGIGKVDDRLLPSLPLRSGPAAPAASAASPAGILPNAPDTLTISSAAPPLSSGLVGQLLLLQSETGSSSDNAAAGPGAAATEAGGSLLELLTPGDRALLKAATGSDVTDAASLDGGGQSPAAPLVTQIALDRAVGRLTGEITPDYLQHAFDRVVAAGNPLDPQWLPNALHYLGAGSTTPGAGHALDTTA